MARENKPSFRKERGNATRPSLAGGGGSSLKKEIRPTARPVSLPPPHTFWEPGRAALMNAAATVHGWPFNFKLNKKHWDCFSLNENQIRRKVLFFCCTSHIPRVQWPQGHRTFLFSQRFLWDSSGPGDPPLQSCPGLLQMVSLTCCCSLPTLPTACLHRVPSVTSRSLGLEKK